MTNKKGVRNNFYSIWFIVLACCFGGFITGIFTGPFDKKAGMVLPGLRNKTLSEVEICLMAIPSKQLVSLGLKDIGKFDDRMEYIIHRTNDLTDDKKRRILEHCRNFRLNSDELKYLYVTGFFDDKELAARGLTSLIFSEHQLQSTKESLEAKDRELQTTKQMLRAKEHELQDEKGKKSKRNNPIGTLAFCVLVFIVVVFCVMLIIACFC